MIMVEVHRAMVIVMAIIMVTVMAMVTVTVTVTMVRNTEKDIIPPIPNPSKKVFGKNFLEKLNKK